MRDLFPEDEIDLREAIRSLRNRFNYTDKREWFGSNYHKVSKR